MEPKVYLLTAWSFNESTVCYVTFNLEVAKEWSEQKHNYGYYDYEEIDVYG